MSMTHWLVVAVVVLLLFGRGKISELMGDVAKGIKSFKKGLNEDEEAQAGASQPTARALDHQPAPTATSPAAAEHVQTRS